MRKVLPVIILLIGLLLGRFIKEYYGTPSVKIDYAAPGFTNIVDTKFADSCIKNYRMFIRDSIKNDSSTQAVWFSKNVFNYVFAAINSTSSCDGVRIYFGKYYKLSDMDQGYIGAKYSTPISLFWVATKENSDPKKPHKDDWDFFPKIYKSAIMKDPIHTKAALNHGQLCPKICN